MASRLSLHACSGSRVASVWADSEPSHQDQRQCHPRERQRKARGLDLVARDKPPDNLMPRAVLRWLEPSLLWARARLERGAGPQWGNPGRRPGAGGLTTEASTAQPGHPQRGTCPTGLAPHGLSGWIRITGGHAPRGATRAASANVQHWPGSDSDESHLDARLGRQPHLWATPVFKWTSRRPGPVGATPAFGHPGNPTEFSDSDRRWR